MGNRIGLVCWLVAVSTFGCGGLRQTPDLSGGGGSAGKAGKGGHGGTVASTDGGGNDAPACTVGAACTPDDPCHLGQTTCGAGGPSCMITELPQANGTVCGQNMVCSNGSCVACAGGTACTVTGKPCRIGTITCDTGAPVCTETNDQPNGSACGADMICQAGQCVACQAGAACTPANPCHQGMLSCATGTPQCLDTGTSVPAGTACGTNRYCSATGVCGGDCDVTAACSVAGKPCRTGTITCNTGAPVCVESGNVQNGTGCGTNQVCSSGACVACTVGLACAPTNPCHAGFTSCSPTITCADSGANLANGASCGTNKVCNEGMCNACTSGTSCQPNNPCHTGATSCVTGTSVCADVGNRPNGTNCGMNQVCNNGMCVPCAAGGSCTPANPCHNGTLACNTGTAVCTDLGTSVGNGTSCGMNLVCKAGSCVSCTAGVMCSPTNPCKLGRTSCMTGSSVCVESGNRAVGTLCGADQSCTNGTLTSAAMCNASQACVTTTTTCPNACNTAGTDCAACPSGTTACSDGCKKLATDAANCGSCGMVCPSPPVAGSGSAVCTNRSCDITCNDGYLACGNASSCQVASWDFEDGKTAGFSIVGSRGAVTSISTSTSMAHGGTTALAIGINAKGTARKWEVGPTFCDGSYLPAMGRTMSAWIYVSPASAATPTPEHDSYAALHLYASTGDGGDLINPLPVGSWFQVQMPIGDVGMRLQSFSLEGVFDTDGTTAYDWSGTVYIDDIVIQ
jgi:hypothetical protein